MGDNHDESVGEPVKEKIAEIFDSSSPRDSIAKKMDSPSMVRVKDKVRRMFGREKPIHHVFGGGKLADIILWRNKKVSAGVLCGATTIWVLFELLEFNLVTLFCLCVTFGLLALFAWSKAMTLLNKSPPQISGNLISEDMAKNVALSLRFEINRAIVVLRDITTGQDLVKFVGVIAGFWVLSIIGSCCNFLTFFYIVFVLMHVVPVIYEKYDDKIDFYADKSSLEMKKLCAMFDSKVLSKIPRGPLKDKKC